MKKTIPVAGWPFLFCDKNAGVWPYDLYGSGQVLVLRQINIAA